MARERDGQVQVKSRAAPRGTDRPQAPTMRLNNPRLQWICWLDIRSLRVWHCTSRRTSVASWLDHRPGLSEPHRSSWSTVPRAYLMSEAGTVQRFSYGWKI